MASDWHLLPKTKPAKPFLVRTLFGRSSYTVHITDLTSIWTETLSRAEIISRSEDLASNIHPEDDSSQFSILLDKIGSAFQDDEGTEIFMQSLPNKLDLFLKIPLPGGLNDLQWSMKLTKQSPSALQSEFINPLVALSYVQKKQVDQLSHLLNEKDAAIGKILDKIESLGLDYGTIFPTAKRLNRKGNLREQILRQVKGLAVFDDHEWTAAAQVSEPGHLTADVIASSALAGCHTRNVQSIAQCLPVDTAVPPSTPLRHQDVYAARPRSPSRPQSQSQGQADEFQRQATPEGKKRTEGSKPDPSSPSHIPQGTSSVPEVVPKLEISEEDEETTDEEDLDGGMATTPVPSRRLATVATARSPDHAFRAFTTVTPSPAMESPRPKLGPIGSRKTAITDRHDSKSKTPGTEHLSTPDPAPPKIINKLGKVGGRKPSEPVMQPESTEHKIHSERNDEEDKAMPDAPVSAAQPAKRKLGKIGGQRPTPSDAGAKKVDDSLSTSRQVTMNIESESVVPSIESARTTARTTTPTRLSPPLSMPPEEDAIAKANRKRDEMKKELDSGKPAPKKKRRF